MAVAMSFVLKGPVGLKKKYHIYDTGEVQDFETGQTYTQFARKVNSVDITFSPDADNTINCYDYRKQVWMNFECHSVALYDDGVTPLHDEIVTDTVTTGLAGQTITLNVPERAGYVRLKEQVSVAVGHDYGTMVLSEPVYKCILNYTYNLYAEDGTIVHTGTGTCNDGDTITANVPTVSGYTKNFSTVSFEVHWARQSESGTVLIMTHPTIDLMEVYSVGSSGINPHHGGGSHD